MNSNHTGPSKIFITDDTAGSTPKRSILSRIADAIDVERPVPTSKARRIVPLRDIKGKRTLRKITGGRLFARATDTVIRLLDGHTVYRYYDDGSLRLTGGRAHRGHAARVARKRRRKLIAHHSVAR